MKRVLIDRKKFRGGIYAKLIWNKFSAFSSALGAGFFPVDVATAPFKTRHSLAVGPENFRTLTHKGINLYDTAVYSICVSTGCYTDEIDFTTHLPEISGYFSQAAAAVDHFDALFEKHRFRKAILFHGYYLNEAVVRSVAARDRVPVLGIERTAHKDRLIWDDRTGIPINSPNAKRMFEQHPPEFGPGDNVDGYVADLANRVKRIKTAQHSSPSRPYVKKTSRPLVVFIGQVYTDASLLFFLNEAFRNPLHVIGEVIRNTGDGCELVVKLHPKEKSMNDPITNRRYDSLTYNKMKRDPRISGILDRDSIVIDHDNRYDTYSIIEQADLVITINSQAGFESLLFGKPVITCGRSFYTGLGFTYDCRTPEAMPSLIGDAMHTRVSGESRNRFKTFCYYFYERYCLDRRRTSAATLIRLSSGS
jgi:hypothetical protein